MKVMPAKYGSQPQLAAAPKIADAAASTIPPPIWNEAIRPPAAFDPASWQGEFKIGMCDNLESAFFGPLIARMREVAPGARLIGVASDKRDSARMLDEGEYDFSVAVHDEPASWHIRAPLFSQSSVCVYDPGQLNLKAPLKIEDFIGAAHVTVSFEGNSVNNIDVALGRAGLRRQVVATVPRFSALPTALRAMPAIATIPESIARCMAQLHGLSISAPPLELPADPVTMLYRRVDRADGRSVWFRSLFIEVVSAALKASGCSMGVSMAA